MADSPAPETDPGLEDTIAAYLQAEEAGQAPTPEQWLARHPNLATELQAFFDNREGIPRLWQPERAAAELPPVPGYEFLGEVGRGAVGVVYKVWDKDLKRLAALKLLRGGASQEDVSRFWADAEILARLQHPNIVGVYAVGDPAGCPYFVMELAEGGSLADVLADGRRWPTRPAADLIRTLARAVDHAHKQGVVHRDLKPANILLASGGRKPPVESVPTRGLRPPLADYVLKIADFGLARQLDVEMSLTLPGAILGTAPYMAPEQAAGRSHETGPAADVYALGAILYKVLTGRPPFLGLTVADTLEQVRTHDPVPPHLLSPDVDQDLEAVCLKCLAKSVGDRYPSAAALADDLSRYLDGEPVTARPCSLLGWVFKLVRRPGRLDELTAIASLPLLLAALTFAGQVAVFLLLLLRGPEPLVWLALGAPYLGLFAAFRSNRLAGRRPTSPAERHLWSIWIGHLLASATLFTVFRIAQPDYVMAFLAAHPARAVVTGLAFFVMGGPFWGLNYAFGLAWMVLALLMPLALLWAPLEAGVLIGLCYLIIGLYLRRLRTEAAREKTAANACP